MKTIDELWKLLQNVELIQIHASEAEAMYKHCFEFQHPLIVEIGCAHGASSIILAEAAKELGGLLTCFDTYPEDYPGAAPGKFGVYAQRAFEKNLESYGDVMSFFKSDSSKVAGVIGSRKIDLLFIDGDHYYDGVSFDCKNLLSLVKPGGYVAFHDYNNQGAFPGVKKAADEACAGWEKTDSVWDLAIFKKP